MSTDRTRLVITLDDLEDVAPPRPQPPPPLGSQRVASPPPDAALPPVDTTPRPAYTICTIRDVVEGQFGPEDSLIFPVPALHADAVIVEPRDGTDVRAVHCCEVEVKAGPENARLLRAPDIRAKVLLTDARLTVACTKYDKGGGWVGGPVAMLALNAGSKFLAVRRRRGKMLVGQIRYPWIRAVYAQNKSGWAGSEKLRVIVQGLGHDMRLELTFPKDVDATAIATELVRRAARFRLTHEPELSVEERAQLASLSASPPIVWRKDDGRMAGHSFPSHWPAAERSARFGLAGGA
jgi:hypothetical protein